MNGYCVTILDFGVEESMGQSQILSSKRLLV